MKAGREKLGVGNVPKTRQILTYEWDTKRGKATDPAVTALERVGIRAAIGSNK